MRPTSIVLPLMALALLLPGLPSNASACSCTNEPDFPRAFEQSDAIFLGEVLAVESAPGDPYNPDGYLWATFQIDADWKGKPPASLRVGTYANGAVCGFPFELGKRYLVYAFVDNGVTWTHLCWRTHETWPEDPDLDLLNVITPVVPGSWGSVKVRYR